jgi:parvulin-like peptidyl-prolyl isomerase
MKIAHGRNRSLTLVILIPLIAALGFSLLTLRKGLSASGEANTRAAEASAVVATVDGRQISARIYRMYLKNATETLGLTEQTEEGRRKLNSLKEGIISELIDRALIEAEARRRNLSFTQEKLNSEYQNRVEQMGGPELYRAYLGDSNITDEEFRQVVAGEIYGEMLRQDLAKDISVTQGEARDFYDKEKTNPKFNELFVEPERVRASHILINARRAQIANDLLAKGADRSQLDRLVESELKLRRDRAAEILNRARAGADFARLAREKSDDPATRERGGDLGLFTRNTHTPKFDESAFAIKPGRMSDVVETEYGFHIIKVAEHRPQRTRGFDEVRPAIEQQLLARKLADRLTGWLDDRRNSAEIDVTPSYRVGRFQK